VFLANRRYTLAMIGVLAGYCGGRPLGDVNSEQFGECFSRDPSQMVDPGRQQQVYDSSRA